ncbi:uncharacterized protein [Miscanthus floridulus]|uniref:uncharacterized protein n=1 Tax=Miscanthus floridulus TaxID=154761 RepID=UPI003457A641
MCDCIFNRPSTGGTSNNKDKRTAGAVAVATSMNGMPAVGFLMTGGAFVDQGMDTRPQRQRPLPGKPLRSYSLSLPPSLSNTDVRRGAAEARVGLGAPARSAPGGLARTARATAAHQRGHAPAVAAGAGRGWPPARAGSGGRWRGRASRATRGEHGHHRWSRHHRITQPLSSEKTSLRRNCRSATDLQSDVAAELRRVLVVLVRTIRLIWREQLAVVVARQQAMAVAVVCVAAGSKEEARQRNRWTRLPA